MPGTVLVALQPFNGGNALIISDAYIEAKDNSADKRCSRDACRAPSSRQMLPRASMGPVGQPGDRQVLSVIQLPIGCYTCYWIHDSTAGRASHHHDVHARSSPASGSTRAAVRNASFVLPLRRLRYRANCWSIRSRPRPACLIIYVTQEPCISLVVVGASYICIDRLTFSDQNLGRSIVFTLHLSLLFRATNY
jgi:hypothetical protein